MTASVKRPVPMRDWKSSSESPHDMGDLPAAWDRNVFSLSAGGSVHPFFRVRVGCCLVATQTGSC